MCNSYFVISAIHVIAYRILYLFSFILFCTIPFDIYSWQLLTVLSIGFAFACIAAYRVFRYPYLYGLKQEYSEIFCILEAFYICQDLSNDKVLINQKQKDSIKRRIKKLSKSIYILGKHNQDDSGYYSAISQDIFNKVDWINKPLDTTLKDLRNYFNQISDRLIV